MTRWRACDCWVWLHSLLFTGQTWGWMHPTSPLTSSRMSLQLATTSLIDSPTLWTASSAPDLFDDSGLPSVPVVLAVGLTIGLAAQLWINRLTQGDGGLGSFLKDGRGYSNSDFVFSDENRAVSNDPLPWLKLPRLDFVEVAGQEEVNGSKAESDDDGLMVLDRLQALQDEMESMIGRGDYDAAKYLKTEIEKLVSDNSGRLRREGEL